MTRLMNPVSGRKNDDMTFVNIGVDWKLLRA